MKMGMQTVRQLALSATITTVLVLGVLHPHAATAATYYVATTGNNANPGTQAQPFQTIGKGLTVLAAGDTLYIRGGTYAEVIYTPTEAVPSGTSWSNPVTIAGYPNETVTLNGIGFSYGSPVSYIIFDHLIIDATGKSVGLYMGDSQHVRFQDGEIKNATAINVQGGAYVEILRTKIHDAGHPQCLTANPYGCYGFYMSGHDNLFDGNEVYNNNGEGFNIYNSGHSDVSNNIVRNNVIYGNGFESQYTGYGILLSSGDNNIAYNNIVYGNAMGISALNSTNTKIYNNTVYNTRDNGIEVFDSASNTVVENNIVYVYTNALLDWGAPTSGTVFATNLCGSAGTGCSVVGNPQFVNAASNDFHLQAGSPVRDAGTTISVVTTDYEGVPRPQGAGYDIGACEYHASQLLAPQNLRTTSVAP